MESRKLIAHGPSSLTIALPHKWIKRWKLTKGDRIAIKETEDGLTITPTASERTKSITLYITGMAWPATTATLTTVYRQGYDEVQATYQTPEEYQHITDSARALPGFTVLEHRKNHCLIKCMPTQIEQDFPTLFRRVFLILLQQLEDLTEVVNDKKSLRAFYHRDADLNAVVNLAIRIIHKGAVQDNQQEMRLFHALLILEECGDDLTRFTIEASKETKPTDLKKAVQHANNMIRKLYDAYFQRTVTLEELYNQYYVYWPDAKKQPAPTYDFFRKQKGTTFYLRSIVEKALHLAETLLVHQKE